MNVLRLGQRAVYTMLDKQTLKPVLHTGTITEVGGPLVWLRRDGVEKKPGRWNDDPVPYALVQPLQ